jgi:hypothetical protein
MSLCWAAGLGRAAGEASVIAAAGGATVSGMARGGPATFGGARGARRSLTVGRLSRLKRGNGVPTGLLRAPEQGHLIAPPWPSRFG